MVSSSRIVWCPQDDLLERLFPEHHCSCRTVENNVIKAVETENIVTIVTMSLFSKYNSRK